MRARVRAGRSRRGVRACGAPSSAFGTFSRKREKGARRIPPDGANRMDAPLLLAGEGKRAVRARVTGRPVASRHPRLRRALIRPRHLLPQAGEGDAAGSTGRRGSDGCSSRALGRKRGVRRFYATAPIASCPSPACGRGIARCAREGEGRPVASRHPRLRRALIRLRHLLPQAGEGNAAGSTRRRSDEYPSRACGRGRGNARARRRSDGCPSPACGRGKARGAREGEGRPVASWRPRLRRAPHPPPAPSPASGRRECSGIIRDVAGRTDAPLPLAGEGKRAVRARVRAGRSRRGIRACGAPSSTFGTFSRTREEGMRRDLPEHLPLRDVAGRAEAFPPKAGRKTHTVHPGPRPTIGA